MVEKGRDGGREHCSVVFLHLTVFMKASTTAFVSFMFLIVNNVF